MKYKIAAVMTSGHMAWWSELPDGVRRFGYTPEHYLEFATRTDAEQELASIPRDDMVEPFIVPVE